MTDEALALAIRGLMDSPHWVVFEQAIIDRRNAWITDMASPLIYQNHAELASTSARMAEDGWFLDTFKSLRTGNVQDT
jgi:hypothetical protein